MSGVTNCFGYCVAIDRGVLECSRRRVLQLTRGAGAEWRERVEVVPRLFTESLGGDRVWPIVRRPGHGDREECC